MQFLIENGVMPTAAARVKQPTGTSIRTMLQVKPIVPMRIVEWGCSFDAFAAAAPGEVELIETDVAATMSTQLAEADITKYGDVSDSALAATLFTLSTIGCAFATAAVTEGSVAAVRSLDPTQFMAPSTQPFVKQFPLGYRPMIQAAKFARIRVTFATTVNCHCYMLLEPA